MRYIKNKNPRNAFGLTPLHLAAQNGLMKVVQLILMNVQDKKCIQEVFLAAAKCGNLAICKYLVAFENVCDSADEEKTTALHYAAENGHLEVRQSLILCA
jgi:ankyrin repeat protein